MCKKCEAIKHCEPKTMAKIDMHFDKDDHLYEYRIVGCKKNGALLIFPFRKLPLMMLGLTL